MHTCDACLDFWHGNRGGRFLYVHAFDGRKAILMVDGIDCVVTRGERWVKDEQVVVHVCISPVVEAATRVAEYQLLHAAIGEQWATVGFPEVSEEFILRPAFRLGPAVGERGDLVLAERFGVDVGVLLSSSRSSASASARYIRRRCADAINLRALNSIPRNKITPELLFKKVNNGSGVSWFRSCAAWSYAPATSGFAAGVASFFSASALFTRSTA